MLTDIYQALRQAFGHRGWWPAEGPLEMMVGAVLTQNTNWRNVEKALGALKRGGLLNVQALAEVDLGVLQELIRPAGYYRQKAPRVQRLAQWIGNCGDTEAQALEGLAAMPVDELRRELLALKGIGPETADSILLYALRKPVFVVDSYTVRVLARHGIVARGSTYEEVQGLFQDALPEDIDLWQDYHAQLVEVGKRCCRRRSPLCSECPLLPLLGQPDLEEDER